VTRFAAFHQAKNTARDEAAYGPAYRIMSEANTTSEPRNGKADLTFSLKAAVTEEVRIDGAVSGGEGMRGTRRSSNCFHTCTALSFMSFMFRSGMKLTPDG